MSIFVHKRRNPDPDTDAPFFRSWCRRPRLGSENNMIGGPQQKKHMPIAQIIGIGMLAWALVPSNPYGYYVILRWVICGIFIYLGVEAHALRRIGWVWVLGITAVIYNPIVRVHANREVWSLVNLVSIAILVITIWVLRRTE